MTNKQVGCLERENRLARTLARREDELYALKAVNAELLAVLSVMLGAAEVDGMDVASNVWRSAMIDARAAIAKATGGAP